MRDLRRSVVVVFTPADEITSRLAIGNLVYNYWILGQTVHQYTIRALLGRGGQGEVYLAEDTLLKRSVAIKFSTDAVTVEGRLLEEARSASQLDHPNIARVYEAGVSDGRLFVVMEYVEGESLAEVLRRGPLPVARARDIVSQILDALGEAHSRGIVHRDIKPSNIMVTARGGIKVLDFGLAKRTIALAAVSTGESTQTLPVNPTQPGVLLGTPAYMSPEQLRGHSADARSDLFACGVVLYECIAGRHPFAGRGAQLLAAILHETPKPLSQCCPEAGSDLDVIVDRALEKNPQDRFQTALEMGLAIRSPSQPATPSRPKSRRSQIAAALLLAAVAVGWWLTRPEEAIPNPAAARWYKQGLEALRDGTYYSAARAFEQVTEADPGFALGHARLGEAWSELDSPEKAQREMLLAKRGKAGWRRRSPSVELTVSAIENLVLRDFRAAAENYRQLLSEIPGEVRPGVWLDLGRAQEKANDYEAALDSYTHAAQSDAEHAAPWLLRGIVHGRRQQFASMSADFRKAQSIYEASQNFEGQAELAFQQGRLATLAKDLPTARASLERALDLARKTGSEFHQIRALCQLSIVTFMEGNASRAQEIATEAVSRARSSRMPFLTVQGLVDLGNAQLSRLDLKSAEVTLREAVALAQADKLPRSEARARLSLGSVLVQGQRDEEALPEINAAVAFYSKGQYRSEINMSRVLLGRVYRRRGEFAEVNKLLTEILRESEAAGDRGKVSDVVGEIANAYAVQEKFADALTYFERRLELLRDSKAVADIGYSLTGKAAMLLHLGALDEATVALDQAQTRAGTNEGVARRVKALHSDFLYRKGQWTACAAAYTQALRETQPSSEEKIAAIARQVECLAFAGKTGEAQRIAVAALQGLEDMKGSQGAAWMRAAFALVEPQPVKFQKPLSEAIHHFRTREQFESLWMAETVAAAAFRRCGDTTAAEAHAQASMTAWKNLESRIPGEYLQKYRSLPWVVHYQRMRI